MMRFAAFGVSLVVLVGAALVRTSAAVAGPEAERLLQMSQVAAFRWSPDGQQIAYLSNESGTAQIHLLTIATGTSRQLTRHEHPVFDPQWSPDGTKLLFLSDPGFQERNELWQVAVQDGKTTRLLSDGAFIIRNARWSPDGSTILIETNLGGPFDLAVWRPDDPVLRPFMREATARVEAQWSPDGKSVAYLSSGGVWIAGARGEEPRAVIVPGLGASVQTPRWSPDGKSIVFVTDLHGQWDVGVYSFDANRWRLVTSEEWEETDAEWSSDGRWVAFISTQGFDKRLGIVDVASGKIEYVTATGGVASSPRWSRDRLAYLFTTPRQPHQVWVTGKHRDPTQLTQSKNADIKSLVVPEPHEYLSRDGLKVPALLYRPAGFKPGTRYPAVMVVHGSFEGQWINDFDLLGQFLLQRGYVLFYPNPRGSGGYGRAYERLNDGDWGGGDTDDLIRGRDYLAGLSFVDSARIGVWGGSYGGYLTYTLVTQAPDKFQAGVVRAGISDLRWQVVERRGSPARLNTPLSGYPKELGGLPDQNPEFYKDRSPITWVDRVKTPMLILHGLRDSRVAPSQSRLWVDALRARGVTVEHHEYPTEDHGLLRTRETIRDQMQRISAFLAKHLAPRAAS